MGRHQDIGRRRQGEIYVGGMKGRIPRVPFGSDELEAAARARMSREAAAYVVGGAGNQRTVERNRAAFDGWGLRPRMLADVEDRDLSISLLGCQLEAPILVAPIGVLELVHEQADLAVARATASLGIPYVFSNQASVNMEACAAAMGDGPRWFQLYWSRSNELVESFVARAERSGCEAIVVTLDTTMLGWRTQDLDRAYLPFLRGKGIAQYTSDPVFMERVRTSPSPARNGGGGFSLSTLRNAIELARTYPSGWSGLRSGEAIDAVRTFIDIYSRPNLTWADLPFLRERTRLPILLKGILHSDDAKRAVEEGADGIIVSNHGGRQVDGAVGALDALPEVVAAVAGRVPVLMDSGIRSGSDIIKAIALGARAVMVGRPYVYGLAIDGEDGVRAVLENLLADLDLNLGLCGKRSLAELSPSDLMRLPG